MSHDPHIFLIGVFTPFQVEELQKANLAKIICANADDIQQVPRDVFILQNVSEFVNCSEIQEVNLNAWKECDSEWIRCHLSITASVHGTAPLFKFDNCAFSTNSFVHISIYVSKY